MGNNAWICTFTLSWKIVLLWTKKIHLHPHPQEVYDIVTHYPKKRFLHQRPQLNSSHAEHKCYILCTHTFVRTSIQFNHLRKINGLCFSSCQFPQAYIFCVNVCVWIRDECIDEIWHIVKSTATIPARKSDWPVHFISCIINIIIKSFPRITKIKFIRQMVAFICRHQWDCFTKQNKKWNDDDGWWWCRREKN